MAKTTVKMWGKSVLLAFTLSVPGLLLAQETQTIIIHYGGSEATGFYSGPGGVPLFQTIKKAGYNRYMTAVASQFVFEPASPNEVAAFSKQLAPVAELQTGSFVIRKENYVRAWICPYRQPVPGTFERLVSFTITWLPAAAPARTGQRGNNWAANSELSSGTWYKLETTEAGVYKLDYTFLKNMGMAIDHIDPRNLRLAGFGGDVLPENCTPLRYDDLPENAIYVHGEADGHFDANDYVLFYAQGLTRWELHPGDSLFHHSSNIYADKGFYFITAGDRPGKRIQTKAYKAAGNITAFTSFDNYAVHETDKTSISHSGRAWAGEEFDKLTAQAFDMTLYQQAGPGTISSQVLSKAFEATSFAVSTNGGGGFLQTVGATSPNLGAAAAVEAFGSFGSNLPAGNILTVNYVFNKAFQSSKGWLDFFELNYPAFLVVNGQLGFRNKLAMLNQLPETRWNASGQNLTVWDITNPVDITARQLSVNGSTASFDADSAGGYLHEYVAFDGSKFFTPTATGKVIAQNLHGLATPDLVIVSYPEYSNEARRLAEHRKSQGLAVVVVEPEQIYNEFSSGKQDITAIRNMMKMWYDRSGGQKPGYLLLFGDASYDYKNRVKNNTNLVPTYESRESYIGDSYCSDDYFGHLDDSEGLWPDTSPSDGLDLAVGRIPVHSATDARATIDKILAYESAASCGDWRNNVLVIGDDEDQNTHMQAAENVAGMVANNAPCFHVDKLYLDAYKKQVVNGVPAYPDVNDELKRQLLRGTLLVNYSGHGGTSQWAHEGIFNSIDIDAMKNIHRLPLFMAATCDFGPYDEPGIVSAGEKLITNNQGGAIGFLGTTRIANTGQNNPVNSPFFNNNIFTLTNGRYPTIGEAYQMIKAAGTPWLRNFTYLGDPSLTLGVPVLKVVADSINHKTAGADTLKALKQVTVSGHISELNGQPASSFNGTVYMNVYDKPSNITTLGNEPSSYITNFSLEKNVIYKGKASVKEGYFSFMFLVPKDINYQWGSGQMNFYANDNTRQAQGCTAVTIGGTAEAAAPDTICPDIKLYMDDFSFVPGGITGTAPTLLAKLWDESGINTTGSGVGRNLTATLDDKKTFVVNDFYQADLNDFRSGTVRYPLNGLEPGRHTLVLKAWDAYNNACQASLEFVVTDEGCITLSHVLNYPNPFTTKTTFEFDHNRAGDQLQVQVQILTVTGQVVRTLQTNEAAAYGHFSQLQWDGTDDYGGKVGRGVYLYRLRVKNATCEPVESIHKMVLF